MEWATNSIKVTLNFGGHKTAQIRRQQFGIYVAHGHRYFLEREFLEPATFGLVGPFAARWAR